MTVIGKNDAGLHRGIVGDDHEEASFDRGDPCYDTCRWRPAPFLIHFEGGEESQFEQLGSRIDQLLDSLPGSQSSLGMLLLDILRSSSLEQDLLVANIAIEQLHPCLAIGPHMHLGKPYLYHNGNSVSPQKVR